MPAIKPKALVISIAIPLFSSRKRLFGHAYTTNAHSREMRKV